MSAGQPEPTTSAYAGRTKYDEPGRARRYARRDARRHAEEWRLVRRALHGRPQPAIVLDAPCGAGRMAAELLSRGAHVRAADLSPAMRAEANAALQGKPGLLGIEEIDLEAPVPPEAPRHDAVLCFRFLHHLPDAAARRRVLTSLAARSSRDVLVSFHHPVSVHQVSRGLRRVLTGRKGDRHAVTKRQLKEDARACGLRWVAAYALLPYLRDLWVAVLQVEPGQRA